MTIIVNRPRSHTDPGKFYIITLDIARNLLRCSCPAGRYNRRCKHLPQYAAR